MKPHISGSSCSGSQLRRIAMYCLSRRSAFRLALLAAAFPLVMPIPSLAAESPLAIQGYDPVAYFTDGKPTRGLPEFEYPMGRAPLPALRARSTASFSRPIPVRYAPQFGNYCAMALARGEVVDGQPGILAGQRRQALHLRLAGTDRAGAFPARPCWQRCQSQPEPVDPSKATSGQPSGLGLCRRKSPALRNPSRK